MYEVKIITQFAAAHRLENFKGKCESLHGHNWKVEVFLGGKDLDDTGLLMDFGEVIARGNAREIQNNVRVIEAYLGRGAISKAAPTRVATCRHSDKESVRRNKIASSSGGPSTHAE